MLWRRGSRLIVWRAHRLIYLRVPKCANTSIRLAIPNGRKQRVAAVRIPTKYPGYLVFSFVRDPWARLVSTYRQKIRAEAITEGSFVAGVHHGFLKLGLPMRAGMPFAEFAEIACAVSDAETEKHLKSQSFFLYRDGERIAEFIGRLESAPEDWRALASRVGFRNALPHLNPTGRIDCARYYRDAALVNRVGDRYRNDVENFGYDSPGRRAANLGA